MTMRLWKQSCKSFTIRSCKQHASPALFSFFKLQLTYPVLCSTVALSAASLKQLLAPLAADLGPNVMFWVWKLTWNRWKCNGCVRKSSLWPRIIKVLSNGFLLWLLQHSVPFKGSTVLFLLVVDKRNLSFQYWESCAGYSSLSCLQLVHRSFRWQIILL